MRMTTFSCGLAATLLIAGSAAGCSRAQPNDSGSASELNVASAARQPDAPTKFDPTTLKEVGQLAELPEGVQTLANGSFMKDRFDSTPTKFLVGGVGGSSALVAYEEGGYVPSYHAQSYVLSNSRWVPVEHWRLESKITALPDLIAATVSQR